MWPERGGPILLRLLPPIPRCEPSDFNFNKEADEHCILKYMSNIHNIKSIQPMSSTLNFARTIKFKVTFRHSTKASAPPTLRRSGPASTGRPSPPSGQHASRSGGQGGGRPPPQGSHCRPLYLMPDRAQLTPVNTMSNDVCAMFVCGVHAFL